jgi:methionine-gamma-lyase
MAADFSSQKGFHTLCIHGGHRPDGHHAHLTPIYASSTYTFDDAAQAVAVFNGEQDGYIYNRWGNPTVREAEEKIALMEGYGLTGEDGQPLQPAAILHASGMAAIQTLFFGTLRTGEAILTQESLYGGTQETIDRILQPLGIASYVVDFEDEAALNQMMAEHPEIKLVYVETPDNPTIRLMDLARVGAFCRQHQLLMAVDNTFCTPYLQQPFKYGADYIVHSTTKYLNGHGTAIGGALVGRTAAHLDGQVTKTFRLMGGSASPFDAFLLVNGMRTLPLRLDRHCQNAQRLADYLTAHPAVAAVHFPGLQTHPQFELARRQMTNTGAMLSFELKGGLQAANAFVDALRMCTFAVSLGTTDTLISHPATSTHKGVAPETRIRAGVTDGLIRVSVGLENPEDILADIEQAIRASQDLS